MTLLDDRLVTTEAFNANFLILPDENAYVGKTIAEICCDSLKEFNPMVHVSIETGFSPFLYVSLISENKVETNDCDNVESMSSISGDLSTFGVDFFEKFDVVVIGYSSRAIKVLIPPFLVVPVFLLLCR